MLQSELVLKTHSEEETEALGKLLGSAIKAPLAVALEGDLGAGKTVFVRGAAQGLGSSNRVASPTFVLMRIYQGRLPLYHFDFYRLDSEEELTELGFEEYLPGEGAAFVEWADRFLDALPADYLHLKIERFYDNEKEGRCLTFASKGVAALKVTAALKQLLEQQNKTGDGGVSY